MEKKGTIRCTWDDEVKNHYVYAHYTSDTNKLFYIGIGTMRNYPLYSQIYQRAYTCAMRNMFWKKVYQKHGRRVEILFDHLTEKQAKEKEIELIAQYGTLIKHTGILCNISEGGEGRFQDTSMCKKVYVYNLQGELINEFDSCEKAAEFYNLDRRGVGDVANMKRKTCGDYQFRYEKYKDLDIQKYEVSPRKIAKPVKVTNVETGEERVFSSTYKFMKFIGASCATHIIEALHGRRHRKIVKGWEVSYANV